VVKTRKINHNKVKKLKERLYNTPEDLRKALNKLNREDRDLIIELMGRDPLSRFYHFALASYVLILSICLIWPFDITFPKKNGFLWLNKSQGIEFIENGQVFSNDSTRSLCRKLIAGSGITVEVWAATNDLDQSGPARIISYSLNPEQRNFTLGQQNSSLIFRLRTTETDLNGVFPFNEVRGVFDTKDIKHIVVTYDFNQQDVYVNGSQVAKKNCPTGTLDNWNPAFPLIIGNEANWERPWLGKVFYAAIYNRPLRTEEIQKHYSKSQSVNGGNYCKNSDRKDGMLVQYCFDEGRGNTIKNSSGINPKLNLTVPKWTHQKQWSNDQFPSFRYTNGHLQEVFLNIVAFIPLGFLLHAICRNRNKMSNKIAISIVVFGAFLSCTFEFIQYFSLTRYSSLLDVLHNSIGTGLGVGLDRWYAAQLQTSSENLRI
jgi:hypothetical protein